jgi:hypothetical protein
MLIYETSCRRLALGRRALSKHGPDYTLVRAPEGSYAANALNGRFIPGPPCAARLGSTPATDSDPAEVNPA